MVEEGTGSWESAEIEFGGTGGASLGASAIEFTDSLGGVRELVRLRCRDVEKKLFSWKSALLSAAALLLPADW